jgi:hypothetical protein
MKSTLIALTLLVAVLGLAPTAISSESIFDSSSYLHGEAGVIAPVDRGESINQTVSVPIALFDGNNWYRTTVEKNTDVSGVAPDFEKDYLVGEGGLVNPIESSMER